MKRMLYLLAVVALVSFKSDEREEIDGIWMGYYRSGLTKEKVIVKFEGEDQMVCYTGSVDGSTRCKGTYQLLGDSVSFTYKTASGQDILMQGHLNYRKTYVDGTWKDSDEAAGKFYLERQKVEERFVTP